MAKDRVVQFGPRVKLVALLQLLQRGDGRVDFCFGWIYSLRDNVTSGSNFRSKILLLGCEKHKYYLLLTRDWESIFSACRVSSKFSYRTSLSCSQTFTIKNKAWASIQRSLGLT